MTFLSRMITKYPADFENICRAFEKAGEEYGYIENTKDIWLRDFMPVQTKSGKFVSFRYEPSYHITNKEKAERTVFRVDIVPHFLLDNLVYSNINLDGGNIVFSPSKERAIISDRIFTENPKTERSALVCKLSELLEAEIIIIESLKSDMTGHADGMVRFADENTVFINRTGMKSGLEQRQEKTLRNLGFQVVTVPYYYAGKGSAEGCYLNYYECESHVFVPVFGKETDTEAAELLEKHLKKEIIPVRLDGIAKEGGLMNCITWEK